MYVGLERSVRVYGLSPTRAIHRAIPVPTRARSCACWWVVAAVWNTHPTSAPGVHLQYNAYQRRVEAMELAGARRDAGNEGGGRKRSNDRLRPGERGAERDSLYMSSMGSPAGSPNKEGQGQSEEGELSGHGLDEFALLHSSPARSLKPSLPQVCVV
jgi:hypothetical protein